MLRKAKWLIPLLTLVAILGIVGGTYLYYGKLIGLRGCAVEINGMTYSSSQPLADALEIWKHEIESISLTGKLEIAIFSREEGFSLVTAEQGPVDVDNLTQVFLLNNQDDTAGEITFICSDGSSYTASLKKNKSFLGVKMLGGEL